jgi:hypothetical protein
VIETSTDNGESWTTGFDALYRAREYDGRPVADLVTALKSAAIVVS